jgi:hypothetical protein
MGIEILTPVEQANPLRQGGIIQWNNLHSTNLLRRGVILEHGWHTAAFRISTHNNK